MATYLVKDASGQIVNTIEWDGVSEFNPGPGLIVEALGTEAPANAALNTDADKTPD